jgi:orotidine-5'-phosphate decarboxylase
VTGFGDRLAAAIETKDSVVCVGLDPRIELIPPSCRRAGEARAGYGPAGHAAAFEIFGRKVIELVTPYAVAIKPQAAFFEALGSVGFAVFERLCEAAREAELLVIADVKRGDIGTTAAAYARAYLEVRGERPPLADCCTVNPYLGTDGIRPFVEAGAAAEGGVFVLVKTSNPSARELQDLHVGSRRVHHHVAALVNELGSESVGRSGYGPVGAVVGATWPEDLTEARKLMPHAFLLVPGFGAQGATARDVIGAFDKRGQGAIVAASRSITFPWSQQARCPDDWEARIVAAAKAMRHDLREAVYGRKK